MGNSLAGGKVGVGGPRPAVGRVAPLPGDAVPGVGPDTTPARLWKGRVGGRPKLSRRNQLHPGRRVRGLSRARTAAVHVPRTTTMVALSVAPLMSTKFTSRRAAIS